MVQALQVHINKDSLAANFQIRYNHLVNSAKERKKWKNCFLNEFQLDSRSSRFMIKYYMPEASGNSRDFAILPQGWALPITVPRHFHLLHFPVEVSQSGM